MIAIVLAAVLGFPQVQSIVADTAAHIAHEQGTPDDSMASRAFRSGNWWLVEKAGRTRVVGMQCGNACWWTAYRIREAGGEARTINIQARDGSRGHVLLEVETVTGPVLYDMDRKVAPTDDGQHIGFARLVEMMTTGQAITFVPVVPHGVPDDIKDLQSWYASRFEKVIFVESGTVESIPWR